MAKKNVFTQKHFHDEDAARLWLEAARWPDGPNCPHCGSLKHYATKKAGRYRCGEKECRKDYTVMTKSVMERSHAKLTQWAWAFHLYASSKKGFTAMQLQRSLGCEYNTAWFLHHRVMEAMRRGGLDLPPMGGAYRGPNETGHADLFSVVSMALSYVRARIATLENEFDVAVKAIPAAERLNLPQAAMQIPGPADMGKSRGDLSRATQQECDEPSA